MFKKHPLHNFKYKPFGNIIFVIVRDRYLNRHWYKDNLFSSYKYLKILRTRLSGYGFRKDYMNLYTDGLDGVHRDEIKKEMQNILYNRKLERLLKE